MSADRVKTAVTGLAAISAAGAGLDPIRQVIASRESVLKPVPPELVGGERHLWARAEGFRAIDYMSPLKARKLDRCSLFAVVAAGMALKDAGIDVKEHGPERIGITLGCGFGGIANSEEFLRGYFTAGTEGLVPMLFPNTVPNAPASNASIEYGLKGPNVTFVQRFCSAEVAVQMACRFLEEDRADVMITGGVDELDPFMIRAFRSMGQLRSYAAGFGEGAGMLVLEKPEKARQRGARFKGGLGEIRTVGRILPGREAEGMDRLAGPRRVCDMISLSGVAARIPSLSGRIPSTVPRLETGELLGRSLAMGGLALVSLILALAPGASSIHFSASPEGPYYGIDVMGPEGL